MINPKYYSRPELFVNYIMLSFNSKCNANCLNCCGDIDPDRPELSLDKAKEILHTVIYEAGIKHVYISCLAEMTLLSYVNEIIDYCKSIWRRNTYIVQDTNGRYIPDGFIEMVNSVSEQHDEYWQISISLWSGVASTWAELQGNGNFTQTVENIKRYLNELKCPPSFSLPYINEEQYNSAVQLIEKLAIEAGFDGIQEVHRGAEAETMYGIKKQNKIPVYRRRWCEIIGEDAIIFNDGTKVPYITTNNCSHLYTTIGIDSRGYVYACEGVYRHPGYELGDVNDYSPFTYKDLRDLLYTQKSLDMKHGNYTSECFACDMCAKCSGRICN